MEKNFFTHDAAWHVHFPHRWPFVRGIHQSLVDSPHKGPVRWNFDISFTVIPDQAVEQGVKLPTIWDTMTPM